MLTGITTRPSTPHEDAEPWLGGSARPTLEYLTGTLGISGADARELLQAARTAQAGGGPGTLADYPVPGGPTRLLIHYAPGSRAYRLKVTNPQGQAPPGHDAGPDGAPGPAPDEPSRGPATPHGGLAGDDGGTPAPGPASPAGPAADPSVATVTITLWHNITSDTQDRPTGLLDGYQPGHPMVRVFTYQTGPAGRSPEALADEAFAIANGHSFDAVGQELSRRYYARELRSLSFPGNSPCCSRSCCLHRRAVWPRWSSEPLGERTSCERQPCSRRSHR